MRTLLLPASLNFPLPWSTSSSSLFPLPRKMLHLALLDKRVPMLPQRSPCIGTVEFVRAPDVFHATADCVVCFNCVCWRLQVHTRSKLRCRYSKTPNLFSTYHVASYHKVLIYVTCTCTKYHEHVLVAKKLAWQGFIRRVALRPPSPPPTILESTK
jgi:hypothetical protein